MHIYIVCSKTISGIIPTQRICDFNNAMETTGISKMRACIKLRFDFYIQT